MLIPPICSGGISVRITDSSGAERLAPLRYVSPYLVNLVVPPGTAKGLAIFTMIGGPHDGVSGHVLIDDISPGLFTGYENGRGPVIGTAIETESDGSEMTLLLSNCEQAVCTTLPVPENAIISLFATGIRNVSSIEHVSASIAGIPVRVLYAGVQNDLLGVDQVEIQLVPELRGIGETDLIVIVDGIPSNAVRINIQ